MVDVAPEHLARLREILAACVPAAAVHLFGSRTTGAARPYSDLDLAIDAGGPIELSILGALEEALQASDLPFRVEVVDWHRISEPFREVIRSAAVPLEFDRGVP